MLGSEDVALHQAFIMYPPLEAEFNKAAEDLPHKDMLIDVKNLLTRKDEFISSCLNFTEDERRDFGFPWRRVSNMSRLK